MKLAVGEERGLGVESTSSCRVTESTAGFLDDRHHGREVPRSGYGEHENVERSRGDQQSAVPRFRSGVNRAPLRSCTALTGRDPAPGQQVSAPGPAAFPPAATRRPRPSVTALEKDILAWVEVWNEDPKPFVWIKTAEEILASLELLLRRIKGEEH